MYVNVHVVSPYRRWDVSDKELFHLAKVFPGQQSRDSVRIESVLHVGDIHMYSRLNMKIKQVGYIDCMFFTLRMRIFTDFN